MAVSRCESIGAELATINNQAEDDLVYSLMLGVVNVLAYIGLGNIAKASGDQTSSRTWAWQNRSTAATYTN